MRYRNCVIVDAVEYLKGWVVEAWGACSHKKIVAASAVTVFWNLSAIKTRIFAGGVYISIAEVLLNSGNYKMLEKLHHFLYLKCSSWCSVGSIYISGNTPISSAAIRSKHGRKGSRRRGKRAAAAATTHNGCGRRRRRRRIPEVE